MCVRFCRLAAFTGLLVAAMSLSPLMRAGEKNTDAQKLKLETTDGSVEFSSDKARADKLGVKIYPGATAKDEEGKNGADLKLTSTLKGDLNGSIRLHVMKFTAADASAKVIAFYKKELARYGSVVECRGAVKTNFDDKKGNSILTCDEEAKKEPNSTVLKAGTEKDQHVVTIKVIDNGTEFSILHLKMSKAEHDTL